ncbi:LuxR C-terminal-related transcriptional regulator [Streptomyces sp. 058-1L]|uniref:LuxR C-terminal-related transcriptional regulator n=1 Tax=Streptomyces sp. 058-1L TaxID=2789266 RepID=UPI00397FC2B8
MRSLVLGAYAMACGTLTAAEAHFASALAQQSADEESWVGAGAHLWISSVYNFQGRSREGIEAARQALSIAPQVSWSRANLSMGIALAEGPQTAIRELSPVLPSIRNSADGGSSADALLLTFNGWHRITAGELEAGIDDCSHALALSQSLGASVLPDLAYAAVASAQYLLGDWHRASISIERAHDVTANGAGLVATRPAHFATEAWLAAGRGEWSRAEAALSAAEQGAASIGGELASTYVLIGRAILAQARGDYRGVLEAVERLVEEAKEWPRLCRVFWLPLHAEALLETGRVEDAEGAVSALRAAVSGLPCLRTASAWLSGRVAEMRGDLTHARIAYERELGAGSATNVIALHRALLEHSYSRVLNRMGMATDASRWLLKARDHLAALGASPFLARCAENLSPAKDIRPSPRGSFADLTKRQRDIALLVGRGLTNREIANELFVSSKTVEYHLSHVYGKLDHSNRRELRDYVQRSEFRIDSGGLCE